MAVFEFTLKFSLPKTATDPEEYVQSLAEAGCDDALIGVGLPGRIALEFDREADSAFEAVSTAIEDVKSAIEGAKLVEVSPDLVGLTDVADILKCSRQYMRKLMVSSGRSFPLPAHEGKASLWRLANLLVWLRDNKQYSFDDDLIDLALTNMQFNIARESLGIDVSVQQSLRRLVS